MRVDPLALTARVSFDLVLQFAPEEDEPTFTVPCVMGVDHPLALLPLDSEVSAEM